MSLLVFLTASLSPVKKDSFTFAFPLITTRSQGTKSLILSFTMSSKTNSSLSMSCSIPFLITLTLVFVIKDNLSTALFALKSWYKPIVVFKHKITKNTQSDNLLKIIKKIAIMNKTIFKREKTFLKIKESVVWFVFLFVLLIKLEAVLKATCSLLSPLSILGLNLSTNFPCSIIRSLKQ